MGISFFPTPSHRVFNYTPRYYSEEKERLRKIYEKYGKPYPGDAQATAERAADDLKDVATYGEVKDILAGKDGGGTASNYVPGSYIRGAYKDGLEASRRKAGNQKAKRIIVALTVAAAFIVAWYLAQGLGSFFK